MELKIKNLERDSQSGLVEVIHYQLWHEGEHIYGSCGIEGDASAADFVPFESLSEAQVLQWLEDKLSKKPVTDITVSEYNDEGEEVGKKVVDQIEGESQLEAMKKQLQDMVGRKKLAQGLPF